MIFFTVVEGCFGHTIGRMFSCPWSLKKVKWSIGTMYSTQGEYVREKAKDTGVNVVCCVFGYRREWDRRWTNVRHRPRHVYTRKQRNATEVLEKEKEEEEEKSSRIVGEETRMLIGLKLNLDHLSLSFLPCLSFHPSLVSSFCFLLFIYHWFSCVLVREQECSASFRNFRVRQSQAKIETLLGSPPIYLFHWRVMLLSYLKIGPVQSLFLFRNVYHCWCDQPW